VAQVEYTTFVALRKTFLKVIFLKRFVCFGLTAATPVGFVLEGCET
jgi:hypothetical protein